ncbi:hypothetical protein BC833DRAFT_439143 [Globomyces pollinis-pini]|nr:hypothetical protein BC833DRAFT_439143 [Globomyces pollinis-pini]
MLLTSQKMIFNQQFSAYAHPLDFGVNQQSWNTIYGADPLSSYNPRINVQEMIHRGIARDNLIKQLSLSLRGHRASDQTLAQLYNGQPVDANNVARNILADRIKDVQVTNVIDQVLIERQLKLALLGLHPGSQINMRSQTPFGGFNVGGLCNPNQVISQQRDEMVDRILENQTLDVLKRDIVQAQQLVGNQLLNNRNVLGRGYNAFNATDVIGGAMNFGNPMGQWKSYGQGYPNQFVL